MRNERKCKSFISTRYTLYPNAPGRTVVYLIVNPVHLFSHLYYLVIRVISLAGLVRRGGRIGRWEPFSDCVQYCRENVLKLFEHDSNRLKIFSHCNNDANHENNRHHHSAQPFTRRNDTSTRRALSDQRCHWYRDVPWHSGNAVHPVANFFEGKILINGHYCMVCQDGWWTGGEKVGSDMYVGNV